MSTRSITTPVEPGKIYHLYNRGVNHDDVFFQEDDYELFLSLFEKFVSPVADVYCYCLIKNHYHFLVKIHEDAQTKEFSRSFASLLMSYTIRINWKYGRRGTLFQGKFKRLLVQNEMNMKRLVTYIHLNPLKHSMSDGYRKYRHSSFKLYQRSRSSFITKGPVLELFDDLENFNHVHEIGANQLRGG